VTKAFTVRERPVDQRPRERLIKMGAEALSVQELLAIVLGSGTPGEPVTVVAEKLLGDFGSLKRLSQASFEELKKRKGLKEAKVSRLKAALELARRLPEEVEHVDKGSVKSPDDAVVYFRPLFNGKKKEHFFVLSLDTKNHVLGPPQQVSIGSLDMSIVHPREVFREALAACAASLIVAHNHPSGDPEPSEEDIKLTKRLADVGQIIGIALVDHLIVCNDRYVSLKGRKLL